MVMISCLLWPSVSVRQCVTDEVLPAADSKECESKCAKHGVDAEIEPKTLIRMLFVVGRPHLDPDGCDGLVSKLFEMIVAPLLTGKRDAKDEDRDGNDKDDGGYPAHRANIVLVDRQVASATIGFRLYLLIRGLVRSLTLSISRRSFVGVGVGGEVPVWQREIEARYIPTRYVELLERTLFRNLAVLVERNNVVRVRNAFG